jgi:hypothetical protein
MKSIRKYLYVAALAASTLSLVPSPASAQEASGSFALTHDVRWQNAIVPAGTYRFTIEASGSSALLTLSKMSGNIREFMLLSTDLEESRPADVSQIVLISRANKSFVSEMKLPEFGMKLRFAVPAESREIAKAVTTTNLAAAR